MSKGVPPERPRRLVVLLAIVKNVIYYNKLAPSKVKRNWNFINDLD